MCFEIFILRKANLSEFMFKIVDFHDVDEIYTRLKSYVEWLK